MIAVRLAHFISYLLYCTGGVCPRGGYLEAVKDKTLAQVLSNNLVLLVYHTLCPAEA